MKILTTANPRHVPRAYYDDENLLVVMLSAQTHKGVNKRTKGYIYPRVEPMGFDDMIDLLNEAILK